MNRNHVALASALALLSALSSGGCSSSKAGGTNERLGEGDPACATGCAGDASTPSVVGGDGAPSGGGINGRKDGNETDVDCGGDSGARCAEGQGCLVDDDCEVACGYANLCVGAPSCAVHLGGDTCGAGEVGEPGAAHESCCRSLEVKGYEDPANPGRRVFLDKYEITAGRVRAFIERLAAERGGRPDVKGWIAENRPAIWDDAWTEFLPSDYEGETIVVPRRLLGDPRPEDGIGGTGPGVILPPDADQVKNLGVNYQFGSEIYVDLHGNNCGTFPGSWGFPTYWYPAEILSRDGQLPRARGKTKAGEPLSAKDLLDVKAMNCITNAMLAAFCAWDGGQLATDEVLDYVTDTPQKLGNVSGCGTQYDDHGALLGNSFANTVQEGGRCAPVAQINATFDAGDKLPVPDSPLNEHNYHYPDLGSASHDKAWQISAPGRATGATGGAVDLIRIQEGDEPWVDLHGNLNEAALDMDGAAFTGKFALKYRGIGYGSARSDLNVMIMRGESVQRLQRPEAKAAYTGGRCMRFR